MVSSRFRPLLGRLTAILLAFAAFSASPAAAADLFGRSEQPVATAPAAVPAVSPPRLLALPAPLRSVVGEATAVQSRLNAALRGEMQLARGGGWGRPALAIIGIAFLYGIFHAVGPGHGKLVVGAYFLSRRARLLHGLAMSGSAALVQALSAVVLVSLLAAVLERGGADILDKAADLEIVSYGVITAVGFWMIWGVLTRRVCCAHGEEPGHRHDHACGHPHHDHAHDHHAHDHHVHDHAPPAPGTRAELWRVVTTGAAVGLRPCSGAILVLLFTLANDIYPIGIAATFAMGAGVALTVSAVSLGTLGINRSLTALGGDRPGLAERLRRAGALAGAAVITMFGLLQLLGIWGGVITPMAG